MTVDISEKLVRIPAGMVKLEGSLAVPDGASGVVLFAHGSGSSRHSPRNRFVAEALQKQGVATLLIDLLTTKEDVNYETRFDIGLLTSRLEAATTWLVERPEVRNLTIGYFGASTGAAAALQAAASFGSEIGAVVSRGGRPDLVLEVLNRVRAPTLLIVGGRDDVVIELNQRAYERLGAEKKLVIVPGATHLFEEPGALEEVARLASDWFKKHLRLKHQRDG
ncbi:MAG: dienelactone hydrolase family protein [Deltaproteobacteria bacterium]|nr:dienelactone hydrolase family protein [Deltaproteobacteria bacterium]